MWNHLYSFESSAKKLEDSKKDKKKKDSKKSKKDKKKDKDFGDTANWDYPEGDGKS